MMFWLAAKNLPRLRNPAINKAHLNKYYMVTKSFNYSILKKTSQKGFLCTSLQSPA